MKSLIFLPFVLLLGLFIGNWAQKDALLAAKSEIEELNEKLKSRGQPESRVSTFTRMVHIPDRATERPPVRAAPPPPPDTPPPAPDAEAAPADDAPAPAPEPQAAPPAVQPEDLRARIDEAKDLWRTRVEMARAQWIARLKLSQEGAAQLDASIDAMNEELYGTVQRFADLVDAGAEFTPELGVRLLSEVSASLAQTYENFNAFMPA
ncbi:MAG: hypothetical protein LBW77_02300, partial [Verrucomicrobiota bacterium]|nr:hypothetical protein [Verrucomicrobiota bacterium]